MVNVTYSYAIVEEAANAVKSRSHWGANENVQELKFSNKWIKSFLNRGGVTRRKITREDKAVPTDEEIHEVLWGGANQRARWGIKLNCKLYTVYCIYSHVSVRYVI